MYKEILFEVNNGIATITFNRPEFANAIGDYTVDETVDALNKCGQDDNIRAVILTGAGKMFSAGGDISKFKRDMDRGEFLTSDYVAHCGRIPMAIRECPKPVIAMINGSAAGGGLAIALACDFRVMTEKSKLVSAYIGLGFCGDMGQIKFFQSFIGVSRTTEILMLSKAINAQEALDLGLCNRVCEVEKLKDTTMELAIALSHQPTQAIAKQKQLFNEFFYGDLEEFILREAKYMEELARTQDHREAVNAFIEKRKPNFIGK